MLLCWGIMRVLMRQLASTGVWFLGEKLQRNCAGGDAVGWAICRVLYQHMTMAFEKRQFEAGRRTCQEAQFSACSMGSCRGAGWECLQTAAEMRHQEVLLRCTWLLLMRMLLKQAAAGFATWRDAAKEWKQQMMTMDRAMRKIMNSKMLAVWSSWRQWAGKAIRAYEK